MAIFILLEDFHPICYILTLKKWMTVLQKKMSQELPPVESSHRFSFEIPKSSHLTSKVFLYLFQQTDFGFHNADKEKTQASKLFCLHTELLATQKLQHYD